MDADAALTSFSTLDFLHHLPYLNDVQCWKLFYGFPDLKTLLHADEAALDAILKDPIVSRNLVTFFNLTFPPTNSCKIKKISSKKCCTRNSLLISTNNFVDRNGNVVNTNKISNNLANPNLKPELLGEFEVGLETRLINNRFSIDFTWYNKKSTNQI